MTDELNSRPNNMAPFLEFCVQANEYLHLNDLLDGVAQMVCILLEVEGSAVILKDPRTDDFFVQASHIEKEEIKNQIKCVQFQSTKSIPNDLFNSDHPSIVNDFGNKRGGFQNLDPLVCEYARCRATVPLMQGPSNIGLLWVVNKKTGLFDDTDLLKLEATAAITMAYVKEGWIQSQFGQANPAIGHFRTDNDNFIHHFSHAIKTPLAVLIASVKLLEKQLALLPDKDWQRITERAHRNLKRLLTIEYEMEDLLRQDSRIICMQNDASNGSKHNQEGSPYKNED